MQTKLQVRSSCVNISLILETFRRHEKISNDNRNKRTRLKTKSIARTSSTKASINTKPWRGFAKEQVEIGYQTNELFTQGSLLLVKRRIDEFEAMWRTSTHFSSPYFRKGKQENLRFWSLFFLSFDLSFALFSYIHKTTFDQARSMTSLSFSIEKNTLKFINQSDRRTDLFTQTNDISVQSVEASKTESLCPISQ